MAVETRFKRHDTAPLNPKSMEVKYYRKKETKNMMSPLCKE
jgi:hypothetical protein